MFLIPSVMTDVITYLESLKVPTQVQEGLDYLEQLRESLILLSLYKTNFTEDWENSKSPVFKFSPNSVHSPRELEFFKLVNQQLFPLALHEFELDERLCFIPFIPQNFDWYSISIDEFEPIEQFLICLYDSSYLQTSWKQHFGINPSDVLAVEQIDWQKLQSLCQTVPEPLSYLYDVMSILDHSTGNIWLDANLESSIYLEWNQDNIDLLTQNWQEALQLKAELWELEQWLQTEIANQLMLINLWNSAQKDESFSNTT